MNQHLNADLIVDFVRGELPPEDDALAHAHLQTCSDCRRDYELEVALVDALRSAAKAEELEMPSLVKAAVWEAIRQAQPSPLARFAALWRPALALPVAAVLLLGGWFASPYAPHPGSPPTIDAAYYLEAHAAQTSQTPLSEHSGAQAIETSMADGQRAPELVRQVDTSYADAGALDAVQ
jgi:predicted anti-sigma-YlaC factor YlaD